MRRDPPPSHPRTPREKKCTVICRTREEVASFVRVVLLGRRVSTLQGADRFIGCGTYALASFSSLYRSFPLTLFPNDESGEHPDRVLCSI